jgi:hypothetical protein
MQAAEDVGIDNVWPRRGSTVAPSLGKGTSATADLPILFATTSFRSTINDAARCGQPDFS